MLVGKELSYLRNNVSSLLGSGHPSLDTIAKYYFQAEGKHVRPLIVLLMARATNGISPLWQELLARSDGSALAGGVGSKEVEMGIDEPLSPRQILNDFNPHMEDIEGKLHSDARDSATEEMRRLATDESETHILPTQRRLAEITEMIHVASLLHDDVIDTAESRRGSPSAPAAFGNKLSILGGDFLLARASVALARLRNNEVVELLATVIANLVEGEVMQLQSQASGAQLQPQRSALTSFWQKSGLGTQSNTAGAGKDGHSGPSMDMFEHYLQKTYLKTAALIGKSARAATILGGFGSDAVKSSGCGPEAEAIAKEIRDAAYAYGRNVGIAFQLVDDLLDFKSTSAAFGKPSGGADLRLGLTTAPVLFAWQEKPHEGLGELVKRKFSQEGDVEKALNAVRSSNGLQRTTELAQHHADLAREALMRIPHSEARDALEQLNEQIITRVN
jgi:hexaprenyl-diphosphate synthase